jgi:hypothetical protein
MGKGTTLTITLPIRSKMEFAVKNWLTTEAAVAIQENQLGKA